MKWLVSILLLVYSSHTVAVVVEVIMLIYSPTPDSDHVLVSVEHEL